MVIAESPYVTGFWKTYHLHIKYDMNNANTCNLIFKNPLFKDYQFPVFWLLYTYSFFKLLIFNYSSSFAFYCVLGNA